METIENRRGRFKPRGPRRVTARDKRIKQGRKNNWRADDVFATINWRVYQHRELWDMIKSAEPGQLGVMADRWREVSQGVRATTDEVDQIVRRLRDSWRGPSAVQAATSVATLVGWANDASQTAQSVGKGLETYSAAVERARNAMPEPVHYYAERAFQDGYNVKTLDGPNGLYMIDALMDDHMPTKREAREAKEQAILVMKEYEATSRGVHTGLPQPFEPPPPTTAGPGPAHSSSGGGGDGQQPVPTPHPKPTPTVPDPGATVAAMALVDTGHTTTGQPTGGGAGQGAGYNPGYAPGTGGVTAGGLTGRGPAAAGGLAARGPAGGPGAAMGVGQVGARSGAGPAGTPGVRGGGAAGSAFYPPFAGGAAGEEDREHKNRYGEGLDLLDDLPPAFPSVLGE